jgi:hypothetical protein
LIAERRMPLFVDTPGWRGLERRTGRRSRRSLEDRRIDAQRRAHEMRRLAPDAPLFPVDRRLEDMERRAGADQRAGADRRTGALDRRVSVPAI